MSLRFQATARLGALLAVMLVPGWASARQEKILVVRPRTLADPALADLRAAAATWEARQGPARSVVDLVCLVPDATTFYETIALWDEAHFFPILIEDAELTPKFLRAFRPARIVRLPASKSKPDGKTWDHAVEAVGRAWSAADAPADKVRPGGSFPKDLGQTPPRRGVVEPYQPVAGRGRRAGRRALPAPGRVGAGEDVCRRP